MAYQSFQTGGADRHWLFDPQSVEMISPILNKLVANDTYFENEDGATTLGIVLDKILEELPPELEEAVRLVHLAGISYRSAARTVGVDHKTIKARAERGVVILRNRLTDTIWLSSLLSGAVPEDAMVTEKVQSEESVFGVLSGLSNIRSNYEG